MKQTKDVALVASMLEEVSFLALLFLLFSEIQALVELEPATWFRGEGGELNL